MQLAVLQDGHAPVPGAKLIIILGPGWTICSHYIKLPFHINGRHNSDLRLVCFVYTQVMGINLNIQTIV